MKIITLTGKAKSGKDSFARIASNITLVFPIGLADRMKRSVLDKYQFKSSDVFGSGKTKETGYLEYPKSEYESFGLKEVKTPWAYVTNKLNSTRLWEFRTSVSIKYDPKIFSYPEDARWAHFVGGGHPTFWLSPREAMQTAGHSMEVSKPDALTGPLVSDISVLRESEDKTQRFFKTSLSYDRSLGLYPWCQASIKEPILIITDVRKPEQLKSLKVSFSDLISVKINRSEQLESTKDHVSEKSVDEFQDLDFDFTIKNSGSYFEFETKVCDLLTNIMRN